MRRLVIRNVGPIKNVDIRLNKVNVFIGPQGSGKSTIAKIISFCSWLEKANEATHRAAGEGMIKRLGSFHHMEEYFSDESVILYEGDNVVLAYNWKEQEHFKKDLKTLIESFRALPAKPEIWLCLPVPAYGHAWSINDSIIYNGVIPYIKEVAREENIPLVYLNTPMQGKRQYFPDTIHPNEEGQKLLAQLIFDAVFTKKKK